MRFKMQVKVINSGRVSWEEYEYDTNDAQECAENIVNNFNDTLSPNESPRELLAVEVLPDSPISEKTCCTRCLHEIDTEDATLDKGEAYCAPCYLDMFDEKAFA